MKTMLRSWAIAFVVSLFLMPATAQSMQGNVYAPSFLHAGRTYAQNINIAQGNYVLFTAVDASRGENISLNTSTGVITLKAGHTYSLSGSAGELRFSGNTGNCRYQWYSITGSVYYGVGAGGDTVTSASDAFGVSIASAIVTPSVDTQVSLMLITVNALTQLGYSSSFAWATIEELW